MNNREMRATLVAIRGDQIERPSGASAFGMWQEFNANFPDAFQTIGRDVWDSFGIRMCRDLVKPPKTEQTQLPGLGDVPDSVTTYDAEGGFVYKRLRYASADDLRADLLIQQTNAEAAMKAAQVAEDRNAHLLPVMDEHGFATAGEAIEWLVEQA